MIRIKRFLGDWALWLLVLASFCIGPLVDAASAQSKSRPLLHPPFKTAQKPIFMRCAEPRVYDGDTIVCKSGYRIRLLGLQSPEIKCRKDIECIPGSADAARESLSLGMAQGPLTYQYIRRDNRSRPVVIVRALNLDSELVFSADQLNLYPSQADRDAGTNAGQTLTGGVYRFRVGAVVNGVTLSGTLYMRATVGATTFFTELALVSGQNLLDLGVQVQLTKIATDAETNFNGIIGNIWAAG